MFKKNKKKNSFLKIVCSGGIVTIVFFMTIIICALMILNFFGANITVSTISNNYDYAETYRSSLNKYLNNGYVPLSRMLYFYLENDLLTFDDIYVLNQNTETKSLKSIESVCIDDSVKNMVACTTSNINDNKEFLELTNQYFNFPLSASDYTVTSFFNEQRYIYGESNVHSGWDFAIAAQTPVYSVCNGKVTKVNYTQQENIPYHESGNSVGNTITIECNDYGDSYYVVYAHLYPNSAKVKVGDEVEHWTEIASVGTTGHSTGNHLHYQVHDKDNNLVDGMLLVDMSYKKSEDTNTFPPYNNFGEESLLERR